MSSAKRASESSARLVPDNLPGVGYAPERPGVVRDAVEDVERDAVFVFYVRRLYGLAEELLHVALADALRARGRSVRAARSRRGSRRSRAARLSGSGLPPAFVPGCRRRRSRAARRPPWPTRRSCPDAGSPRGLLCRPGPRKMGSRTTSRPGWYSRDHPLSAMLEREPVTRCIMSTLRRSPL